MPDILRGLRHLLFSAGFVILGIGYWVDSIKSSLSCGCPFTPRRQARTLWLFAGQSGALEQSRKPRSAQIILIIGKVRFAGVFFLKMGDSGGCVLSDHR
jgi:hypothetical protein